MPDNIKNPNEIKLGQNTIIAVDAGNKNIILAGGCFWGTEEFLRRLPGVVNTYTAYANGNTISPTYEEVCTGETLHAEAVYVEYNPEIIDLAHLLYYFFKSFDPTELDKQGNDLGKQYRNGIYYLDEQDLDTINFVIKMVQEKYQEPLATEVLPLDNLSKAEEFHQDYLIKNPLGYCHVDFRNLPDAGASMKGDNFE